MLRKIFDRFNGPKKVSGENRGPKEKRPPYLEHALKTMSPEDRRVVDILRASFEKRGKKQNWYYAGAGTDIVPVLIAPEGTTHHFVDPLYEEFSTTEEPLQARLEKSFLRSDLGAQHQDHNGDLRTSLPDGSSIEWKSKSAELKETVPDQLDVVYTNHISPEPNPQALQKLKVGGLFVLESPPHLVEGAFNHPSGVLRLTDAGLKPLKEGITVQSMNPQDAEDLLVYYYGGKNEFNVFEKTREFTPEEQVDLILNYGCKKMFLALRAMAFRLEKGQELSEEKIQEAVDWLGSSFERGLKDLLKKINEEVPEHMQNDARKKFMHHFGNRIVEGSDADVLDWMFDVDAQTKEFAFARNLDKVNGKSFNTGFIQIVQKARSAIQREIPLN